MYIFVLYEMSRHTNNSFLPWSSCMLSWYGKINGIVKSVFVQLSWQIWSDLFLLPVLHWSIYYVPINRIYVNIVKRCLFCYHGYHMCKFRFFSYLIFFPHICCFWHWFSQLLTIFESSNILYVYVVNTGYKW